jgi:hypothetical protein
MAQTSSRGGPVESAEPHPILPQLRLDDLLAELQGRLQAVMSTRDRVHGLLEAGVVVGSNLELEAVLRRIVEAAVTLVDARYGALGVIGEDGIGETNHRSGLANLARRARQYGGTLTVAPAAGGGTELDWRASLSPARP